MTKSEQDVEMRGSTPPGRRANLAMKPLSGGTPAMRDQREREGGGEQRRALGEPGEMMDFQSGQAALQHGEDDEAGEGREQVGDEIDADRDLAGGDVGCCGRGAGRAASRRADDGDEDEAAVADAGVAEQPLEVALRDGGEVAEQQRERSRRR